MTKETFTETGVFWWLTSGVSLISLPVASQLQSCRKTIWWEAEEEEEAGRVVRRAFMPHMLLKRLHAMFQHLFVAHPSSVGAHMKPHPCSGGVGLIAPQLKLWLQIPAVRLSQAPVALRWAGGRRGRGRVQANRCRQLRKCWFPSLLAGAGQFRVLIKISGHGSQIRKNSNDVEEKDEGRPAVKLAGGV